MPCACAVEICRSGSLSKNHQLTNLNTCGKFHACIRNSTILALSLLAIPTDNQITFCVNYGDQGDAFYQSTHTVGTKRGYQIDASQKTLRRNNGESPLMRRHCVITPSTQRKVDAVCLLR